MFDNKNIDDLFRKERERKEKELSRALLLYEKAMDFIEAAKFKEACDI